jgi:hypothetical protein
MVALAKDKETYPGLTFKALIHRLVAKDGLTTIGQITAKIKQNFPRKANDKLPKRVASLLRALNKGRLKFEVVEVTHVAPPEEPITIKGVEYTPPKPKKVKAVKLEKGEEPAPKRKTKSAAKVKTKTKIKAKSTKSVVEDEPVEV